MTATTGAHSPVTAPAEPPRGLARVVDLSARPGDEAGIRRSRGDQILITVLALAVWGGLVALVRAWGMFLEHTGHRLTIYTYPVLGGYRVGLGTTFWLPIAATIAMVALLPRWAARLSWRAALAVSAGASVTWWVSLAAVDGWAGLTDGLAWRADFQDVLPGITTDPRAFLSTFVDRLGSYGIQVRAHPPGLPLLLAAMSRAHLDGPGWAAAVVLASASAGVVGVLVAVRRLVDEGTARRALPFLVLAPAALWIATSFDALYLGVGVWMITLLVLAADSTGTRAVLCAVGAGVLATAAVLLSYGLVLLGGLALLVVWHRRSWRTGSIAAAVTALGVLAFAPFGFWWPSGLAATRDQYYGLGLDRPYSYFVIANLGAWALVIGPATAVALTRLCDRRLWVLVGGGLAAVVVADVSGLSLGEVERIWLPFSPWVIVAGAVLGGRRWTTRGWLASQAATALIVTARIRTLW
jgi:hypothetical protein